jgi:ABC-type multidrug transport system fused ATPase/permease subunit
MVVLGYKRPLKLEDLYDMEDDNKASSVYRTVGKYWIPMKNIGLTIPLFKAFWPYMLLTAFLKFTASLLMFVNPILLDLLLQWMQTRTPLWHGFLFAGMMFAAATFESFLNNIYEYRLAIVAMRMRSAITDAIFQKTLKLSPSSKAKFSTGQVVNLMAVDSQQVIQFMMFFNYIWAAPMQIGIALFLLWQQLGPSTLSGLVVMLLLIPINGYITAIWRKTQGQLMKDKDKRAKTMDEILSGIKVLKLYGWEPSFAEQVKKIRSKEVANLSKQSYFMSIITFTLSCAPIFVALASFVTYVLVDPSNNLDPSKAFVSLTLFNLVRLPLTFLPLLLTFGTMFLVSMKRVSKFLNCDEADQDAIVYKNNMHDSAVKIENATFSWTKEQLTPTLQDVNIDIKKGELVAIVGRVGSGKSSLLSTLLNDIYKLKGNVSINGSLAYVPQQAWIQNATLRQNIVFTNRFDESKYKKVIEASALTSDIKILAAGDNTEIGEKGINLSGGQKQRVSLARAVYADSDIMLMDDPLSAVDTLVGKHIFEHVIGPNGLLRSKTRVLVTQKISLLPHVDRIIVMTDGKVSESGSYQELMNQKGAFADFLLEYLEEELEDEDEDPELKKIKEKIRPALERHLSKKSEVASSVGSDGSNSLKAKSMLASKSERIRRSTSVIDDKKPRTPSKAVGGKLIQAETEETGGVGAKVYKGYFIAMGLSTVFGVFFLMTVTNGINIYSSLWLSYWADDALVPERANDTSLRDKRLIVYGVLGVSESVLTLFANLLIFLGTLRASGVLHNIMLESIMHAPMSFFDTTPMGRIQNRFTKDIDALDTAIRMNIRQFLNSVYRTLVTLIIISLQTPLFLVLALPLSLIYYIVQRYYIASSRQLKRIESTSRSPIYTHFSETVSGSSCIRAYGVQETFINECEARVDKNAQSYILSSAASRWLGVRLEFVGNIIVFASAMFAVTELGSTNPALAGLTISYALTVTQTLNMMVRGSVDLENNLVSAERCIEYTKIPSEAPWYNEANKPKKAWPDRGIIQFDNYSTRYRDGLDLVLRRVSFSSKSSEKIGIVGRTGAGKSSLTLSLFRLIEPTHGSIIIDNVDITRLGLQDLRSRLTIIPQDPVLFTGNLRLNLDPFEVYSDGDIWNALELAHLKDFVSSSEGGLDFAVSEGGDNLSVGQRQLICLARALLRKSKILVLDEATAAVDVETDDLIQKTIRKEFASSSIITIAHRLNTVIDYDRILVLDEGEVAEFDTPQRLMSNPNTKFYSMARAAGLTASNGTHDVGSNELEIREEGETHEEDHQEKKTDKES